MGNCQAIDAAALVVQHPSGKIDRFYWPVTASEVMRMNPGHYVSLIIPLPLEEQDHNSNNNQVQEQQQKTVRFTRVKLLRPTDTLALGHAYRLITSQEVMKVLRAKKYAKTKNQQQESSVENLQTTRKDKHSSGSESETKSDKESSCQVMMKQERHKPRTASNNNNSATAAAMRSKSWRPSLQSISEATI